MSDHIDRAFDLIVEISKHVITLSTGVIALSITFSTDFLASDSAAGKVLLLCSWGVFIIAIFASIFTLMTCTGQYGRATDEDPPNPYARTLTIGATVQLFAFAAGLILSGVAVALSW